MVGFRFGGKVKKNYLKSHTKIAFKCKKPPQWCGGYMMLTDIMSFACRWARYCEQSIFGKLEESELTVKFICIVNLGFLEIISGEDVDECADALDHFRVILQQAYHLQHLPVQDNPFGYFGYHASPPFA